MFFPPTSTRRPPSQVEPVRPPSRSSCSTISVARPRRRRQWATATPDTPPPTTRTRGGGGGRRPARGGRQGERGGCQPSRVSWTRDSRVPPWSTSTPRAAAYAGGPASGRLEDEADRRVQLAEPGELDGDARQDGV